MKPSTSELLAAATAAKASQQAAIIHALREAAEAGDWVAFMAAERAMWDVYHQGGIKLNPGALPPEVALAWHEAMRALLERPIKIEEGK